jgi:hypothetical protein
MFRNTFIALTIVLAAPTYGQVRVINGDIEHIYGPGGQLLDDSELQAKNDRAERARLERQREIAIASRQEELLLAAERARQAAQDAAAQEAAAVYYDSQHVESYAIIGGYSGRHGHAGAAHHHRR